MTLDEVIEILKTMNEWRRWDGELEQSPPQPCPRKFGIAIDASIEILYKYKEMTLSQYDRE